MIENFGDIIKHSIHEHNITQKQFAEELNISPQALNHYLNNRRLPQLDCFFRMIDLLGLNDMFYSPLSFDEDYLNEYLIHKIPELSIDDKRILFIFTLYIEKNKR